MYFGKCGELISEKDPVGDPGRLGDSCHNTSRWTHLLIITGRTTPPISELLLLFRTDKGYIRHPDVPWDWKETDTPNDLLIPYLIALDAVQMLGFANELRNRVKAAGWRCGNGDFINPILWGLITKSKWLLNICLVDHALLSYIPIRWSDEKKRLTWEPNSSADFLNFAHACWHIDSWAFRLVSHERFMKKIRGYFEPEPNVSWLIDLYEQASLKARRSCGRDNRNTQGSK